MIPVKKPRLSTTVTEQYLKALEDLVERGIYLNQGEAVRTGLRLLFTDHNLDIMWGEAEGEKR